MVSVLFNRNNSRNTSELALYSIDHESLNNIGFSGQVEHETVLKWQTQVSIPNWPDCTAQSATMWPQYLLNLKFMKERTKALLVDLCCTSFANLTPLFPNFQ